MKILVINAGSSSLKFQLINMANKKVLAKGNVERIGESQPFLRYKAHGKEQSFNADIPNHTVAMAMVLEKLTDKEIGVVGDLSEINGFGHRIVNVGEKYFDPIIVTKEILEDFKTKVDFSPLHVPGAIADIVFASSSHWVRITFCCANKSFDVPINRLSESFVLFSAFSIK